MLIGNRVPTDFFVTSGVGESEITIHAGSYHLALRAAGIEMANIMTYSSILPRGANKIEKPESITHGEVMESIMAVSSARYGDTATAGIIYGWLYTEDGEKVGGLVCEYNGSMPEENARPHLREMINELHSNGYEHLELRDTVVLVRSVVPKKMYGTALVALCFTSYEIPTLDEAER